ncbi:MAG: cobyrinate a,c-diamide synthase [Lachnospiraceae bacterium]|nr:cobyrinate a,c-diamide synthase [Lachnospiraceae bacterium]
MSIFKQQEGSSRDLKQIHLNLDHLAVGYHGKALIHGIEIGVQRGEIVTLVGPNGSGKSTILKTITRQLTPVSGDIFLAEGRPETTASGMKKLGQFAPAELARQMAVMLTGRLQTELMTCRDVAAMGRYPYTGRLGILLEADEQKVDEALAAVHARHLSDRPFDAVSDGERQRILLARAICQEPEIIILDEPTSYLDIRHKLELLGILHKMSREQGITVVMSLHEIDLAMKISDRIICVKGEEIFACGKPSEILDDETVRQLYDLDPELGRFDARTGSLELFFAKKDPASDSKADVKKDLVSDSKADVEKDIVSDSKADVEKDSASDSKVDTEKAPEADRLLPIPRLMLAAPSSGSGKTMVTCGLLSLLQRKNLRPAAFKCGPDYIDPMFHRQVLGIPSRNLDTFFSPADSPVSGNTAKETMARACRRCGADIAVIEGVMGYYDGTGVSGTEASSCQLARQTDTPVVLVVNARGMSRSISPMLKGFADYEKENPRIRGVILNRISSSMFPLMKKWIEEDTDLKVIGYVPNDNTLSWGSRHLGLLQPEEVADLQDQINHLADVLEKTIDIDALLQLAGTAPALEIPTDSLIDGSAGAFTRDESSRVEAVNAPARDEISGTEAANTPARNDQTDCPRIAVARDEAFSFYYEDNLELLQEMGAELVFFSPVHDRTIPRADGLLLGGGYPELHAKALADNETMKEQIRELAAEGMPILAECGGFMYLQQSLDPGNYESAAGTGQDADDSSIRQSADASEKET